MKQKKTVLVVIIVVVIIVLLGILEKKTKRAPASWVFDSPLAKLGFEKVGVSRLHKAVLQDDRRTLSKLLKEGADPNVQSIDGTTPLHMAAVFGKTECMQILMANGADIEARSLAGDTPLTLAATCAQPAALELLLSNGADPNAKGKGGLTAMECIKKCEYNMTHSNVEWHPGIKMYLRNLKACRALLKEYAPTEAK